MQRRSFLALPSLALGAAPKLPNLIFILADDMGYGDVGCYNPESKIPTPHIDRLASQGMRFTDAHTPSAVCTPTRYGVLTGRYAWRTRLERGVFYGFSAPLIEAGRLTVAGMLRAKGYRTACVGKWHLGMTFTRKDGSKVTAGEDDIRDGSVIDFGKPIEDAVTDRGFDYFFGAAACPTTDWLYSYIEGNRTVGIPAEKVKGGLYEEGNPISGHRPGIRSPGFDFETVDLVFRDKSVAFLEEHVRSHPDQPFFLYHALQAPHLPALPAKQFGGVSKAGVYGDFNAEADWVVGEIVSAVDRLGIAGNTLIIFTSDNGPETCMWDVKQEFGHDAARPWRGMKRDNWEGGHRVPFVARWPGKIRAGSISDETICLTDFMATAASLVRAELPDHAAEDSFDFSSVLLGAKSGRPVREATVHHSSDGAFAIRQGNWKLLLHQGSGNTNYDRRPEALMPPLSAPHLPGQLYDLAGDPGERRNLYGERPEMVARLSALLDRYKKEGRSAPRRRRR